MARENRRPWIFGKRLRFAVGLLLAAASFAQGVFQPGYVAFHGHQALLLALGAALLLSCLGSGKAAAAVAAGTAAGLLVFEGALQVFYRPYIEPIYRFHERYLHENIPNSRRLFRFARLHEAPAIEFRYNSQGFRGGELREDALRVVAYGDSFIAADVTAEEESFTVQLGRRLTRHLGEPVEVVNAGVNAYGPDQALRKLSDEIPRLQPALALVAIYSGNDFGDLIRNKLYRLDSHGRLRESEDLDTRRLREFLAPRRPRILFGHFFQRAYRGVAVNIRARLPELRRRLRRGTLRAPPQPPGSMPYEYFFRTTPESALRQRLKEFAEYADPEQRTVRGLMNDSLDFDLILQPHGESARYKKKLMARILERMVETIRANDSTPFLLLIPDSLNACEQYIHPDIPRRYPQHSPREAMDFLEATAEELGVHWVSLWDVFRGPECTQYYRPARWDMHWSPAGQARAAEVVAGYLVANRLLPGREAPRRAQPQ